ncbi:MAG TPA: CPBP family intramembrane glutamic endopeptidase [Blastocatellia bacterium]|nr:CPBP family intramembrane glutamic endopeptidase [Blastocatellia bacterium]
MNTESRASIRSPGFWRTLRLLLGAARRRASGRSKRQKELFQHRSGKSADTLGWLGLLGVIAFMALINSLAAYAVNSAISVGQRMDAERQGKFVVPWYFLETLQGIERGGTDLSKESAQEILERLCRGEARSRALELGASEEEQKKLLLEAARAHGSRDFISKDDRMSGLAIARSFSAMLGSIALLWWIVMMMSQGEGLELDLQRRRHPMWEWLFSHPAPPAAIFLAEMLSPIAANPIYLTGPFFCGFLYGSIYGAAHGLAAMILVGAPISVATACVGKAFEIGIMLRFSMRSRGAMIGLKSWVGYASMLLFAPAALAMPQIAGALGRFLQPLATSLPWPWLGWFVGARPDGSFSFISGIIACWLAAIVMIAGGVWYSVWGARRGLAGDFARADLAPSTMSAARKTFFRNNPLFHKELLWFLRDRGAIVQTILIPLTIAGYQLINLRGIVSGAQGSWNYLAGAAIVVGTYFLWVLGPKSLASEGPALWLALTWPRGLEGILKSKARLWSLIATGMVALILAYAIFRFPQDAWKVLLTGIGWLAFGRGMAEKSVTLVSTPSSSGEPEPIPKGRQWAASLGMLTFGIGVVTQRWQIAVMGIVYSWVTAAAMWQNFRARLPFLYDPWSEKLPPPPTVMHAMIAISALIEGGAVVTGICTLFVGAENIAWAQAIAYGICAAAVAIFVSKFLVDRGVALGEVLCWRNCVNSEMETRLWWSGDGTRGSRFAASMAVGVLAGAALGLLARGYIALLLHFPALAETIHASQEQMAKVPGLKLSYGLIAIAFAPFAEEYLFRGLLFRALDREWGGWRAVAASAALFAIYHPPMAWLPVGLLGIVGAMLFKNTGRLAPAVIFHMAYNTVVLI